MEAIISGKRIYLARMGISQVTDKYYSWLNNPEVNQYLESRFVSNSIDQIKDFVHRAVVSSDIVFAGVFMIDNDNHIGNIKLGNINWIHRTGDIGLLIGEKEYWGKGYASEAIELITNYAFNELNLHKVWAGCYGCNTGSIKAFKNAGFYEEARLKEQYFCKGVYMDGIIMARLKEAEL